MKDLAPPFIRLCETHLAVVFFSGVQLVCCQAYALAPRAGPPYMVAELGSVKGYALELPKTDPTPNPNLGTQNAHNTFERALTLNPKPKPYKDHQAFSPRRVTGKKHSCRGPLQNEQLKLKYDFDNG